MLLCEDLKKYWKKVQLKKKKFMKEIFLKNLSYIMMWIGMSQHAKKFEKKKMLKNMWCHVMPFMLQCEYTQCDVNKPIVMLEQKNFEKKIEKEI